MSAQPKDGGAAFPMHCPEIPGVVQSFTWEGMSLRDYFAAQCLYKMSLNSLDQSSTRDPERIFKEAAVNAYKYADYMLAERAK